ncbi:fungal-specific transcription factor domain-containing protein [Cokeromyces recurvatus]|uniref:fungal-specific transcription factor domain-containing protein n=1 Tax=Cokeromyces recurvatus TaxID=90255 RepID=UPI00221EF9A0|nr:fungal-specific transcription factor domain-containing protein [Cokeromyces recurvatus]KAI7904471.1 fungal-specific transcription factor domain-containing protein [Cokeromyces recurvatus]
MSNNAIEIKITDNVSENESMSERKRYRITRACDYCRRKKVKCHFTPGQACTNCVSYGITCQFNDGAKKRGPPKGYIDALEKRIRRIEEALQQKQQQQQQQQQQQNQQQGSNTTPSSPSITNFLNPSKNNNSIHLLGNGNKRPQGASSDRVQYLGDLSSFQFFSNKIHLDDKNTKWKGHHIRKFGKQIVLVEDLKDEEEEEGQTNIPQSQLLPHIKSIHNWIYSVTGVDRHTSDRLLKIYFANIHPVLPVVNKTSFLKQYRDQADTYPPSDLLNAMFGAAARFVECEALIKKSKPTPPPPDTFWDIPLGWSDQFFEQAETIITTSAVTPTISKVQAIILIHNHSSNLDSKSSACWLLGGLAIRLAQGLGLNRDCEEWDIPESEKQTRKRIWWSLYVADRFHSASLGRPISIRDEDNDVGYPDAYATWKEVLDEPDDDEEEEEEEEEVIFNKSSTGTSIGSTLSPRFPSAMSYPTNREQLDGKVGIYQLFIELVKLSEILGKILQGLYTPKAKKVGLEQCSDAIVTQLDHELTEWRFGFPEALQKANFDDFDENKGYLAPVTASVLLCYFSLLILLHRPFIEQVGNGGKKGNPSYSSFKISTSAATRGIRIASQMTIRDFLMFPYSFSLYPVLQYCLIHMYNTKNPDTRISTSAKADLSKGIALIYKLRSMSNTAQRLYRLLKTIMNNKGIDVTTTSSEFENSNNDISPTIIPSRLSDVGRGNTIRNNMRPPSQKISPQHTVISPSPGRTAPISSQSPQEQHYLMRQFKQSLAEAIAPPNMDGLLSQSSTPSPTFMSEAFSLKQFGFNNTIGEPNPLDYTAQDNSSPFSKMEILPPMPTLYNTNYQNLSIQQQQEPQGIPSSAPPLTSAPYNNTNIGSNMSSLLNNEGLFKNNPNNPFFGIPTSMDWTEWNEWSQSNQGNTAWQQPLIRE